MERNLRRTTRTIKLVRKPGYCYDEESERILTSENSDNICEHRQRRFGSEGAKSTTSDCPSVFSDNFTCNSIVSTWSELHNLPTFSSDNVFCEQLLNKEPTVSTSKFESGNSDSEFECEYPLTSHVNKPECARRADGDIVFRNSSTRYDLLDLDNTFLSASSSVRADSSDNMSHNGMDSENKTCECGEGKSCAQCSASAIDVNGTLENITQGMNLMLAKLTSLQNDVAGLKRSVKTNGNRISNLENTNSGDSDSGEGSAAPRKGVTLEVPASQGVNSKQKEKDIGKYKLKNKQQRVLEERERTLNLLLDKMHEDEKRVGESQSDESSGDELNLGKVNKKLSRKQKKRRDKTAAALLKEIGSSFPDEDEDASASGYSDTGTDSDSNKKKSKSKRKVKSGAEVKRRPVVRTELWPHTIANEDDGEGVTKDNIILSKFLSCYTYIMISCEDQEEATGRASLLHAVTTVLECLPWNEARAFHNLIMVKIEQGRIDWATDFTELGDQFLNKKLQLSLRSRGGSAPRGNGSNSGYGRGFGKGFGSYSSYGRSRYPRNEFPGGKSRYTEACRQWNSGTCSYGKDCRMRHCCSKCLYEGKPGEKHKASSCENSSGKGRADDQRL